MVAFSHETDIQYFSRTYLESFTTQELLTVASQLSIDLPDGLLSRMLIIGEILDAVDESIEESEESDESIEESGETIAARDDDASAFVRSSAANLGEGQKTNQPETKASLFARAEIPSRYNITFIKALVRDPLWVFVFWEVKESMRLKLSQLDEYEGLRLRLNTIDVKNTVTDCYSVPVGEEDSAWYLDFPDDEHDDGGINDKRYFVELYALAGGKEEALSRTRVFSRPAVLSVHETEWYFFKTPLALLSGINDLPILREKKGTAAFKTRVREEKEIGRGGAAQ